MVFVDMRFFILLLAFSVFMSGYCAAAHAFGEIPMQDEENNSVMAGMPDCPSMKADTSADKSNQHPAKATSMNCKACCASLTGFTELHEAAHITVGTMKFPLSDYAMLSEFCFPIFHPPKSQV